MCEVLTLAEMLATGLAFPLFAHTPIAFR